MKRISRFLLLALILVSLGSPNPGAGAELTIRSEEQLRLAEEAMSRSEYQRAIVELERFLHFFPGDEEVPRARYLIGLSYMKLREFQNARSVFEELMAAYPGTPAAEQARFMIAESFYAQGLFEEAEKIYRRIAAEEPDSELRNRAIYRLGWTMMQTGRWNQASRAFDDVSQTSPLFSNARDLSRKSLLGESLPSKDPTTAGILAAALPGLGHAYTTRYKDAAVAFLLNGLFIWAAYESFNRDHEVLGGILTFLELGWYSGNIYSAVNSAHKYNRAAKNEFLRSLGDRLDVGLYPTREGLGVAFRWTF
jgi:TolA-binding protein